MEITDDDDNGLKYWKPTMPVDEEQQCSSDPKAKTDESLRRKRAIRTGVIVSVCAGGWVGLHYLLQWAFAGQ